MPLSSRFVLLSGLLLSSCQPQAPEPLLAPGPSAELPGGQSRAPSQKQAPSEAKISSGQGVASPGDSPSSADHVEGAAGRLDHGDLDRVLRAAVNEAGWVDYGKIRRSHAEAFERYLGLLGAADLAQLTAPGERMAFWINAYNALCLRLLLDHGLPDEVPHAHLFGKNIFRERTYRVAGKVRSLDDIEHGILRQEFSDPRVHAAIVCGASSCPRLRPEAFVGARLEEQLDDECRRWVRSGRTLSGERKNHFDAETRTLFLSKIFSWFEEDFGGEAGVRRFVARFGDPALQAPVREQKITIRYLPYDWSLNRRPES